MLHVFAVPSGLSAIQKEFSLSWRLCVSPPVLFSGEKKL
jgi:hypothetical protein